MFSSKRKMIERLLIVTAALGFAVSASGQRIDGVDAGLGGANSITGTVLGPSGQRVERRVSVRLSTMTRGDRIAVTDDSGNFGFRGLTNGDYIVSIDKEKDYEPYSQNVNVFQMRGTPGQNYMLSVRLKHKASTDAKPGVMNAELAGVPKAALDLFNKAAELAKKNDRKGAIEQLKRAISAYPDFIHAYNDMGVQHLRLGELDKADQAFAAALKIKPDAHDPMVNRGIVLFQMKRFAEAEPVLREVVKQKEQDAVGQYFLGQTLANLGKFVDAEKALLLSIQLGGEPMKEAHRLLAIIYSSSGDNIRAAASLETYLKLNPNTPDAEQLKQTLQRLRS